MLCARLTLAYRTYWHLSHLGVICIFQGRNFQQQASNRRHHVVHCYRQQSTCSFYRILLHCTIVYCSACLWRLLIKGGPRGNINMQNNIRMVWRKYNFWETISPNYSPVLQTPMNLRTQRISKWRMRKLTPTSKTAKTTFRSVDDGRRGEDAKIAIYTNGFKWCSRILWVLDNSNKHIRKIAASKRHPIFNTFLKYKINPKQTLENGKFPLLRNKTERHFLCSL